VHKCGEERAGESAGGVGALGVPLHGDYPMTGVVEFDRFDDSIGGGEGSDAEIVARGADGLVVAGVHDLCVNGMRVWLGALWAGVFGSKLKNVGEARAGGDADEVGVGDGASRAVVHGDAADGGQVLNEGAVAPDVEGLGAVADGEDGLLEVEGVLEEKFVDCCAGGIGGAAGGDGSFAVALRVDVEAAAWKEHALGGGEKFGDAVGTLVEGDEDGGGTGRVEGGEVGRQGALIVLRVDGGLGEDDADRHGESVRQGAGGSCIGNWDGGLRKRRGLTDSGLRETGTKAVADCVFSAWMRATGYWAGGKRWRGGSVVQGLLSPLLRLIPLPALVPVLVLLLGMSRLAAEPRPDAVAAFDADVRALETRLAQQHRSPDGFLAAVDWEKLRRGEVIVEHLTRARAELPGALEHDWRGTAFVAGAKAADFERVLREFGNYTRVFAPQVERARVLAQSNADHLQAEMRVRQKHVITVVMDTDYDIVFGRLDARHGSSASRSTKITEIADAGTSQEHALSAKEEHGFLWRLNSYWSYEERDGGLYLQIESISLTRSIPTGLGWIVGPFVESVPRESLDFTLRAACAALRK
jgi:hypothetical protein